MYYCFPFLSFPISLSFLLLFHCQNNPCCSAPRARRTFYQKKVSMEKILDLISSILFFFIEKLFFHRKFGAHGAQSNKGCAGIKNKTTYFTHFTSLHFTSLHFTPHHTTPNQTTPKGCNIRCPCL